MLRIIEQTERELMLKDEEGAYFIQAVCDDVVRCVYTRFEKIEDGTGIVRKRERELKKFEVKETEKEWVVSTDSLNVAINKENGYITYYSISGNVLLQEGGRKAEKKQIIRYTTQGEKPIVHRVKTIDGERNFIKNLKEEVAGTASKGKLYFKLKEEEGIFGFGQAEEGIFNYRYADQYLYQHNMRIPMPFFLSSEGYGMLVDCGSPMVWHGGKEESYLYLDTVYQLDTYFIAAGSMDGIVHNYRMLTGKAVMLPRWAFGYIQSKEMYHTAQELLDVVKEYRKREIPLDCVVQDWNSWKPGHWGEKILDPERFGDAEEKLEEIHALHAHAMISVWPTAAEGTEDYNQFLDKGYLLNDCSTYNAFDERARNLYWKQASKGLFSKGFDAWWCDSTEPFTGKDWNGEMKREPWERYTIVSSEHKSFLRPEQSNMYALMHAKGIYENQRKETAEKRVVNLTRSGYAGSQRYGAILWSGDISATWEIMRRQIVEGLQMGMSGYPYWTLDIGAFFTVNKNWKHRGCGANKNPNMLWFWHGDYEEGAEDNGYKELYTRWLQLGTFLPVFRSHGTDTPREIWNFGEPGSMFYDAIEKFIKLRYRLMPYIYSLAAEVYLNDGTMMRSLLFDFQDDEEVFHIKDGFMFGKSLLIYPVTEPMYYEKNSVEIKRAKTKTCYLPKGSGWYDFWTNKYYEGGQYIEAEAPIDRIPVFVKEGAIIPTVEQIMYADAAEGRTLKLSAYAGKDGSFTYYEDCGDGYGYEDGEYALTEFIYDQGKKKIEQKQRIGSYPGMKELSYEAEIIDR